MMRLEAADIVAGYGKIEVLHGATLRAAAGEIVCIIGPNGSGKSTLLKTVFGLLKPAKGTVSFDGKDITRLEPEQKVRLGIAFIPQGRNVFPSLTVRENLRYFARIVGAGNGRIDDTLSVVGLEREASVVVGRLSGGERARVSLATALLAAPDLLVLDEPTVGLDPVLRRDLWRFFHELAAGGTTLLVSSHVMDEASRCDRLLLIREGAILADDTPDGIRAWAGTDDLDQAFLAMVRQRAEVA